jgi:NAD-specific glutamate dehydrogenase
LQFVAEMSHMRGVKLESEFPLTHALNNHPLTLKGRIDRLEELGQGAYSIHDYKTGPIPEIKEMKEGRVPQLIAYALMLEEERGIWPQELLYWALPRARHEGKLTEYALGEMTLAVGIPFVPTMVASQSASIPNAMKSLLAADAILGSSSLRKRIRSLDTATQFDSFSAVWDDVAGALRKASSWLLQWHSSSQSLQELISLYADSFARLRTHARVVFTGDELIRFEKRVSAYRALGVREDDAVMLSLYRRVYVALEVLWCAREYSQDVTDVARVLSFVLAHLGLPPIFAFENTLQSSNKWEQELATGAFQEIRRSLSCIVGSVLSRSQDSEHTLALQLSSHKHCSVILSIMKEVQENIRSKRPFTISVLPLLARHIRELSRVMTET